MSGPEPAGRDRRAASCDEFAAASLSAVDPAEAAKLIACIVAGRQGSPPLGASGLRCRRTAEPPRAGCRAEHHRGRCSVGVAICAADPLGRHVPDQTAATPRSRQPLGTRNQAMREHGIDTRTRRHADADIDREAG